MANKHKPKNEKRGDTWVGMYPRRTKTKKEKLESIERKHKHKKED